VLNQPYDHLNKLIATFDADFPHDGVKATSGAAVLLNGAAISWKTRRQTTVSLTSTEAEVKAMVPGVEMIKSLTGLWAEFMYQPHGCVRVLDDSKPVTFTDSTWYGLSESRIVHIGTFLRRRRTE